MAKVTVRVHYEISRTIEVPDDMNEEDVTNKAAQSADEFTCDLRREDLGWLGTYVEDEDGDEIATIS